MSSKEKLDYFLSEIEDIKEKQKPLEYYWYVQKHYKKNELKNVVFQQQFEFRNALRDLTSRIKSLATDVYQTADLAEFDEKQRERSKTIYLKEEDIDVE